MICLSPYQAAPESAPVALWSHAGWVWRRITDAAALGGILQAMKSETLQEVIGLVAEQTGVAPSRISAATRLGEDLGVDGDDASDLLAAFASRFHVELAAFEFSRHFGPEAGWSPFHALYCLFTCRGRTEPVTVGQLAESAERGVWKYPA